MLISRKRFHKAVAEFDSVVEILDAHALVSAVGAVVLHIEKHAGDAVGGDAGDAEIFAVGRTGGHRRDDGDAGPHCGERAIERVRHFLQERGGRNGDDGDKFPARRFLWHNGDAQL